MKGLNNMKFIVESSKEIERFKKSINDAETYKDAKKIGNMALGHINCMITYLNCMIDTENNDFTAELDEVIEDMTASVYQAMADKAHQSGESSEVIFKCLQKRDEHRY